MPKTPGKMHMYEIVMIDTIVFETAGGVRVKAFSRPISKICKAITYLKKHRLLPTYMMMRKVKFFKQCTLIQSVVCVDYSLCR